MIKTRCVDHNDQDKMFSTRYINQKVQKIVWNIIHEIQCIEYNANSVSIEYNANNVCIEHNAINVYIEYNI